MIRQQNNGVLDLRGLALVAVATAWLAGIFFDSFAPLPTLALLVGAGAALLFIIPLWHSQHSRLIMFLIACLLLGA